MQAPVRCRSRLPRVRIAHDARVNALTSVGSTTSGLKREALAPIEKVMTSAAPTRLDSTCRSLPEALFLVDGHTGMVMDANTRAIELLRIAADELRGRAVSELLQPSECTPGEMLASAGVHEEVSMLCGDGDVRDATVTVGPGHPQLLVVRDVTERRWVDHALLRKHLALHRAHQEIAETLAALERTREAAELRERERDAIRMRMAELDREAAVIDVVAEIAHGINNPLAALESSVRRGRRSVGASDGGLVDLLDRQALAVERIRTLVVDLLAATGSEVTGPRELQASPRRALDVACTLLDHRLARVTVERSFPDEVPDVRAREDDVVHVLLNVLDNALIVVGDAGHISLELAVEPEHVAFIVSDDGPGIPPHVRDAVLESGMTTRPQLGGHGLGLAYVRRVLRRHGGALKLEDRPGGGARVIIHLPKVPR